ncbi:hypothetical protein Pelo_6632 [Pelomyxa schiedti]|nr:hypothetical protein Pelo_6632 [Pelomyxa schiedti]
MSADDASSAHVVGPEEAKPQADGAQVGAEEERRDARGGTDDGSATKGHGDADRDQPPTTTDDEDFNQRPTETETETETKKPQPQPPCDCDNEPSGSRDCEKEGCEYKCDTDTVANITPDASVVAVTSSDTPVTVKNEVATITEETKTALEEGVECENISTCITVEKGSNTEACDVASVSTTVEEGAGGTVVVPGLGEACNCDQDIKASETNTTATELPGIAEGKRRVDPTPIPEDCTTKDAASGSSGDNVSNCVPTGPDLSVPIVDAVERKPPASVPQLDPTGNTKVPEVDIRKTEEAVVTVLTKLEIEPEKGLETEVAVETHSTPIDNPTQEKDLTKSIDMTKLEPNSTVESVHDLTVANTSSAHETTKDSPPIQKETSSNPVIISETQPDQATTPSALNPPEHPTVSVITPEVQITRKGGDVEPQITPHSGKATSCCCDSCTAKKKTENDNKSNELHGLQLPKLPLLPQQQTQTSSSPQQTSEKPLPEKQSTLHQRAIYHQRQAVLDGGIGICV